MPPPATSCSSSQTQPWRVTTATMSFGSQMNALNAPIAGLGCTSPSGCSDDPFLPPARTAYTHRCWKTDEPARAARRRPDFENARSSKWTSDLPWMWIFAAVASHDAAASGCEILICSGREVARGVRGARAWRGAARAARQRRRRHLVRRAHREVLAVGPPRAAAHLALELPREVLAAHERLVAREVPNGEVAVDQPEHELPRRRPRGEGDVEVGVAREDVRLEHLRAMHGR